MTDMPNLMRKNISYWWLVAALGAGAGLWVLMYHELLADPLLPYDLAHRLAVAAGLIVAVLGAARQWGKPLRARLRGYYTVTLPAALFAIIIGGNAHWFTYAYFCHATPRLSRDGFIMQSTGFSCAPASVANLVRLYGIPAREGEAAIAMRMAFTGSNFATINNGLTYYGFATYDTGTTLAVLRANARPCLVSIFMANGMEHSCVLLAMTDDRVWLVEPLQGQVVLSLDGFVRCWSGRATFASPPGVPPPYDFACPFSLASVPTWLAPTMTSGADNG